MFLIISGVQSMIIMTRSMMLPDKHGMGAVTESLYLNCKTEVKKKQDQVDITVYSLGHMTTNKAPSPKPS